MKYEVPSTGVTIEVWRKATVEVLLALRRWALRFDAANPLTVWDVLGQTSQRAALRAKTVQSWASTVMAKFKVTAMDARDGKVLEDLVKLVGPDQRKWLNMLRDEHPFLMTMAKQAYDKTKGKSKAKTEASVKEASEFKDKLEEPKKKSKSASKTPSPAQGALL